MIYDRDLEEKFVNEVITDAIINVGELLDVPQNISGMFLRYTALNPEFEKFSSLGLQKAIMDAEKRIKKEHRSSRDLPSWERIEEKIPGIRDNIIDVIEAVKRDRKG